VDGWISLPSDETLLAITKAYRKRNYYAVLEILSRYYGILAPGVVIDPDAIYTHCKNAFLSINAIYLMEQMVVCLKSPDVPLFTIAHEFLHHLGKVDHIDVSEESCDVFANAIETACRLNPLSQRFSPNAIQYLEFIQEPRTLSAIHAKFGRIPWILRGPSPFIHRHRIGRQVSLQLNERGRKLLSVLVERYASRKERSVAYRNDPHCYIPFLLRYSESQQQP
jgi:hypothetical protein